MNARPHQRHIVIIGGGFSGTMLAVNLARHAHQPLTVTIINPENDPGRGVAYGSTRPEHLLNVAARNMSAMPDKPNHFVEWLQTRCDFVDVPESELRETFVPRQIYGDYIRSLFEACYRPIGESSKPTVSFIDGMATSLENTGDGQALVYLTTGEPILADAVVMATGNQPPSSFPGSEELDDNSHWVGNPWRNWHRDLPAAGGHIVLLGTGLTMVDAILTLTALEWKGTVTAVSRSGSLPMSHFRGTEYPDYLPLNFDELDLSELVQIVKKQCELLRAAGQNPCIAIDKLRPHTQRLWRRLSLTDKRTFLRDYATIWNVMRHRIAPEVHQTLTNALESGMLKVEKGSIEKLTASDNGITVTLTSPSGETSQLEGDRMINCTGPQSRFSGTTVPFFRRLLDSGLANVDDLDMGIQADEDHRVLNSKGKPSSWLYAMGPLLKGSLWETTAVPELRVQAIRLARQLLDQPSFTDTEPVIEYCI